MTTMKKDNIKVLHCVEKIVHIEKMFNDEVDVLLNLLGLTRKEVNKDE